MSRNTCTTKPPATRSGVSAPANARARPYRVHRLSVVHEEALAGGQPEPARQRQAADRRGGAVALLPVLEVERVEHAEDVVEPDRIGPREDPARIVEPMHHPGVDV